MKMVFEIPYKTCDEIPNEELLKLHQEYWEFIAEKGLKKKPGIVSKKTGKDIDVYSMCFLCEYASRTFWDYYESNHIYLSDSSISQCNFCPFKDWVLRAKLSAYCLDGAYNEWLTYAKNGNLYKAKEMALKIAHLDLVPYEFKMDSDSEMMDLYKAKEMALKIAHLNLVPYEFKMDSDREMMV